MIKNTLTSIFLACILFISFFPLMAAAELKPAAGGNTPSTACTGSNCTLENPLGKDTTPQTLIGRVIKGALGVVGSLALLMFIYGGFTWMLAAGNAENVKKGRDILIWAAIGLIIIFTAYALVNFVLKTMLEKV